MTSSIVTSKNVQLFKSCQMMSRLKRISNRHSNASAQINLGSHPDLSAMRIAEIQSPDDWSPQPHLLNVSFFESFISLHCNTPIPTVPLGHWDPFVFSKNQMFLQWQGGGGTLSWFESALTIMILLDCQMEIASLRLESFVSVFVERPAEAIHIECETLT